MLSSEPPANLARRLARSGYAVVATARRAETLNSLHAALNLPLEVTQQECLTGAVEYTLQRLGRFDILLNNADYALPGTFEAISDK